MLHITHSLYGISHEICCILYARHATGKNGNRIEE